MTCSIKIIAKGNGNHAKAFHTQKKKIIMQRLLKAMPAMHCAALEGYTLMQEHT